MCTQICCECNNLIFFSFFSQCVGTIIGNTIIKKYYHHKCYLQFCSSSNDNKSRLTSNL